MDVVINIEPDQEDEMCPRNQQKPQKKRRCSIWFWLCLFIVPVVLIGSGVTAYFLIPKGPDPTPQPTTTTSPESHSSTTTTLLPEAKTTPPITSKTTAVPETTTTRATPQITTTDASPIRPLVPGDWIRDVPMLFGNNEVRWNVGLYYGVVSHEVMLHACATLETEVNVHQPVYFNSKKEEASFDNIIYANSATVFGTAPPYNEMRLLWTGCHYERKNNVWNTKCGADLENYSNFCNQSGWKTDLEQLKASTANEAIYIVKDYGNVNNTEKTNPCWQLYDSKQLKSDMGDNSSDPVLPFTCFTQRKYEWS